MREDLLKVVRAAHWNEIAEYLGQPVRRVRETFRYHFELLDRLGYVLVAKNDAPTRPVVSPATLIPVDAKALYFAVEGAILETTQQRLAGERISDQAEVRAIVAAVEAALDQASAGA